MLDVEISLQAVSARAGRLVRAIVRDVTERRRVEEALRESEARYRRLLNSTTDYIYTVHIENGCPVSTVHGLGCVAVTGYSSEDYAADAFLWHRMVHPEDCPSVMARVAKALAGEAMLPFEHRIFHKDGSVRWLRNTIVIRKDAAGRVFAYDGLVSDITAHKRAEEALRKSEEKFATAFQTSPVAMAISTKDGVLVDVNDAFTKVFGYFREEAAGKTSTDLHLWLDINDRTRARNMLVNKGDSLLNIELRMCHKTGGLRHILFSGKNIVIDGRECFLMIFNDITERKLVEEALRIKTIAFDASIAANSVTDTCGIVTEANDSFLRIYGCENKGEVVGRPLADFFNNPDETAAIIRALGGASRWEGDFIAKRKDGTTFIAHCQATVVRDADGRMLGYQSAIVDITERKQAEERLQSAQQQLEDIIEFLPDATFVVDKDKKVIAWNHAVEEMTGIPKEAILGKDTYSLCFYKEQRPILIDIVWETEGAIREKYPSVDCKDNMVYMEAFLPQLSRGKGAYCWATASRLFDVYGNAVGAIESVRDISRRKAAEDAIRRSEERYRLLYENMTDSFWTMDFEGRLTFVNPPLTRLVGYSADELMQMGFQSYLSAESAARAADALERERLAEEAGTQNPARSVILELEHVHKDGRKILCEVRASFLRDHTNKAIGIIGITRDISERKALEKTQRLIQLGKLVADMAHEVNNPLMIISGNAQLSLMPDSKIEETRESLNVILAECDRAKNIIQRLLHFSRPGTGQFRETDINSSIDLVAELLSHQFAITNVRIEKDYDKNLPLVLADDKQLQEVIINLFNNARDAMPGGGAIRVRSFWDKGLVHVDVTDTGAGMSSDIQNKILEPFFTTKEKGTGLGLPVCFGIIKAHNGELLCDSSPGRGTTMSIVLPAVQKG